MIKAFPEKSTKGNKGKTWYDMAVENENLGRVPESYSYYIEALKSGVPEPINSEIRNKLGIPGISEDAKYPKLIKTPQSTLKEQVEKEKCTYCGSVLIKDGDSMICSHCGNRM
ncbi:MAG: hypothetical protein GY870_03290 [archaeon]|nr:hypothetical protein [archaeon]